MVTREEFLDVHEAWRRGKSISAMARETGRDRKTIRRLLREGRTPVGEGAPRTKVGTRAAVKGATTRVSV